MMMIMITVLITPLAALIMLMISGHASAYKAQANGA